jgi:hypothetical protein
MELNGEVFYWIFIALFIVVVITIFRVKYLLKVNYPEQHNEIYGSSILNFSPSNSMKITRLSLSRKEWGFVKEEKILSWLQFYRFISIAYLSYIAIALICLFTIGWK